GGEARVEVDRAEVVDGDAGVVERGGTGGGDRRGGGQVGPLGDEPLVGRRGAGVQEHPLLLRYAECLRRRHAGDDHRGGQVHLEVGAHELRVGVGDCPVAGGDRGDLVGGALGRV